MRRTFRAGRGPQGLAGFERYAGRASGTCNPDMASTAKCFTSIAVALADKLDSHTPPGSFAAALAAWNAADNDQGATLTTAKQKRAAAVVL